MNTDETCAPQACPVAGLSALPNLSLWTWFSEILKIESSGIDMTSLALAWPIHILRAFADLRLALIEQEKRRQSEEAIPNGCQ